MPHPTSSPTAATHRSHGKSSPPASSARGHSPMLWSSLLVRVFMRGWGPPRPCNPLQPPPQPQPCSVCCTLPLGTGQELFISHIVSRCRCRATRSPVPPRCPLSPSPQHQPLRWTCVCSVPITPCPLSTVPLSLPAISVCSALIPGTMPLPLCTIPLSLPAIPVPLAPESPPAPLAPLLAKGCSPLPAQPNYPCLLHSELWPGKNLLFF